MPSHLTEHIDYITPGIRLHHPQKRSRSSKERRSESNNGTSKFVQAVHTELRPLPEIHAERKQSDWLNSSICDTIISPVCIRSKHSSPLTTLNSLCLCDMFSYPAEMVKLTTYEQTNIVSPKGKLAAPGNELGIFQNLNQHYFPSDLDDYWNNV